MPVGTVIPAVADVLHSTLTKSRRKLVMASHQVECPDGMGVCQ